MHNNVLSMSITLALGQPYPAVFHWLRSGVSNVCGWTGENPE